MPQLYDAKKREEVRKRVPQFTHLRRTINSQSVPPINMQIGFQNRETGDVKVVNSDVTPSSQFPRSTHKKVFEIASVKVYINIFRLAIFTKIYYSKNGQNIHAANVIYVFKVKF